MPRPRSLDHRQARRKAAQFNQALEPTVPAVTFVFGSITTGAGTVAQLGRSAALHVMRSLLLRASVGHAHCALIVVLSPLIVWLLKLP